MNYVPLLNGVNAHLQSLLSHHTGASDGAASAMFTSDELRGVQNCLDQVAPYLPEMRLQRGRPDRPEVSQYFRHLQQLVPLLEKAEQGLAALRTVVGERHGSLQRAQAWADTYKALF
jgi:hypothetical protein